MKKLFLKLKYVITFCVVLLLVSAYLNFRIGVDYHAQQKSNAENNKTVVNFWIKDGNLNDTRQYQVDRFNAENKDNIQICLHIFPQEDYANLLRIGLSSISQPDIFEFGYYDLVKLNELMDIKKLGINLNNVSEENLLHFNNKVVGVKSTGNDVKLVCNKEILKRAGLNPDVMPKSWAELMSYAEKIKQNCPNVIPFEIPGYTWGQLKYTVGEVSASNGNIYTSFWNYKEGKYDFSSSKDIINILHSMYSEGILDNKFDAKNDVDLRRDFYDKKAAMIIAPYEDRDFFSNIIPLDFNVAISDIPQIDITTTPKYYYTDINSNFVINKNIKNKNAVKIVYEWLFSNEINSEISNTKKTIALNNGINPVGNDKYASFSDINNFSNETFDPSFFTRYNDDYTKGLVSDAIKGNKSASEVISTLNDKYEEYCKDMIRKDKFNFKNFVDTGK